MTEPVASPGCDGVSPGALLKAAREARDMDEREAAERLHWVPEYVAVIERDEFMALRSPTFARGYVRAYGRLLEVNEDVLLRAFDAASQGGLDAGGRRRARPQDMQRTGLGVVIGLTTLFFLVLALWWLRGGQVAPALAEPGATEQVLPGAGREILDGSPASPAVVGS